ncbi:FAR [Mytilus coruscus]|uniref:Fatty acyl-CoA reductase n=1 Tax=Mytilus coruscus TaxID=42192 RepID=A0A6J8EA30_MYTCO|nr:FAR [Mytilus coruscus]
MVNCQIFSTDISCVDLCDYFGIKNTKSIGMNKLDWNKQDRVDWNKQFRVNWNTRQSCSMGGLLPQLIYGNSRGKDITKYLVLSVIIFWILLSVIIFRISFDPVIKTLHWMTVDNLLRGNEGVLCVTFVGGLGNHIFQFASTFGIAKSKNMTVVIDSDSFLSKVFKINVKFNKTDLFCKQQKSLDEKLAAAYDPSLRKFNSSDSFRLGTYLQSWKYFHEYEKPLRNHLTFRDHIVKKANSIIKQILTKYSRSRTNVTLVGVHIRRGDMVNNKHGFTVATPEYILKAVNYFLNKYNNVIFIVASNGLDWAKQNMPGNIRVEYIHEKRTIDMATLSSCDHTIMTVGTFGWWCAWLTGDSLVSTSTMESSVPSIPEFYRGKGIFITGATGFMGKVLVEKILRSCPEVKTLYLLVRPKKGKEPVQRIEEIVSSKLFNTLREDYPEFHKKLIPVCGDILHDNLGVCQTDEQKMIDNVQIVFHSAATVRFDEEMKLSVEMNVHGTNRVLQFCKKLVHIESFLHVSTAYANCNVKKIEEKVYEPPLHPSKILDATGWMGTEILNMLTPKMIKDRPNTYTYTKSIAEYLVHEARGELPVAIFRPSIVGASWEEPVPGWVDNFNGPTGLLAAIGNGLLRNMIGDSSKTADIIPVDTASNMMIASAWNTAVNRSSVGNVYHCTTGQLNKLTWGMVGK